MKQMKRPSFGDRITRVCKNCGKNTPQTYVNSNGGAWCCEICLKEEEARGEAVINEKHCKWTGKAHYGRIEDGTKFDCKGCSGHQDIPRCLDYEVAVSEDEIKKKLADKLREVKRAIDSLGWYECEECGKFLLKDLDEVHSYRTKDREVIVCYACLEKCERAMIEEG